jgi:predicted phage tail component-like protein
MIGFSYNGTHSRTYSIIAKSVNRPMLPALRRREVFIPGRHGMFDFGENTFDKRIIDIEIKYIGSSLSNLRSSTRSISDWLSGYDGEQQLIFDDETDKYYLAKIYSDVGLQNLFLLGQATLQFECDPFAYSTTYRGITATVTASGDIVSVSSSGTFETLPIITLKNNGASAITTFTLSREVLI